MVDLSSYIDKIDIVKLLSVGDCMAHTQILEACKTNDTYDFSSILKGIEKYTNRNDISCYTQESLIGGEELELAGGESENINGIHETFFNSPKELAEDMIKAGFNTISLANNHYLDKGIKGVRASNDYWSAKRNVNWFGTGQKKYSIIIVNNIKIAFIGYNTRPILNTQEHYKNEVSIYDYDTARKDIKELVGKVDFIIVFMHWGIENSFLVSPQQERIANELSSLGVNLIIGSHPHVVQPIRWVNDTLVAYSVGNFLCKQDSDYLMNRVGGMLELTLKRKNGKIMIDSIDTHITYIDFTNDYKDFKILVDDEIPKDVSRFKDFFTIKNVNLLDSDDLVHCIGRFPVERTAHTMVCTYNDWPDMNKESIYDSFNQFFKLESNDYILGFSKDRDELIEMLNDDRFSGYGEFICDKTYEDENEKIVREKNTFLARTALKRTKKPVYIHWDINKDNINDLIRFISTYKDNKIVLCHCGMTRYLKGNEQFAYECCALLTKRFDNLYLDISWHAQEFFLDNIDSLMSLRKDRILCGTDNSDRDKVSSSNDRKDKLNRLLSYIDNLNNMKKLFS